MVMECFNLKKVQGVPQKKGEEASQIIERPSKIKKLKKTDRLNTGFPPIRKNYILGGVSFLQLFYLRLLKASKLAVNLLHPFFKMPRNVNSDDNIGKVFRQI